jgi:hypothetical protein
MTIVLSGNKPARACPFLASARQAKEIHLDVLRQVLGTVALYFGSNSEVD